MHTDAAIDEGRAMREQSAGYVVTVDVTDGGCCGGWLSKEVVGPSVDGQESPFFEHTPCNNDVDFSLELVIR